MSKVNQLSPPPFSKKKNKKKKKKKKHSKSSFVRTMCGKMNRLKEEKTRGSVLREKVAYIKQSSVCRRRGSWGGSF